MNQRPFGVLFVFLSGCVNDSGMMADSGGGSDGGGMDGSVADSPTETGTEAGTDGGVDAGPTYSDITDTSKWETFDMSGLTNNNVHYTGGAFDGRYVYYVPRDSNNARSGLFTRFDTMKVFKQANSWETFDLASKGAGLVGFDGAVFDGAYVYLMPYAGQPNTFVRYKTSQPFAMGASYETADLLSLVASNAKSFSTGVFDGKYVYITPCFFGLAVRFDTSASMSASMSYSSSGIGNDTTCYTGSNFDGKYIYYVPQADVSNNLTSGKITRFDISKSMNDSTAYKTYDLQANVDNNARGFLGSVFDGRYLYLIPYDGAAGGGVGTLVVRYDTQAQFDQMGSWTKFDLTNVSGAAHGYNGGTFDGRYVWFTPSKTSFSVRYDTQKAFGSTQAWQGFDLSSIDVNLKTFFGAVFDGEHVYFVPYTGPIAARFDAKTPPSLPPQASSFY